MPRLHQDWSTSAFSLPPVAPHTGPFAGRPFLETWWRRRSLPGDELVIAEADAGLVVLMERSGRLEFAGEPDLTDYHVPLGPGAHLALGAAIAARRGRPFRFDSLPEEAAAVVGKALAEAGSDVVAVHHESAAVLDLPDDVEGWLAGLGKKERHEIRRKGRRFSATLGAPTLRRSTAAEALEAFVTMHQSSPGEKGRFMDERMEHFFRALVEEAGFVVHLLLAGERPVAAAFGHESRDGYHLYNSAYAPDAADASPGMVLLAELVAAQIERGSGVFDFMKGDETYKFRHGAVPRPLFLFEGTLP